MARIFIAYSHDDSQFKDELLKHLSVLRLRGHTVWHDRELEPGAILDSELAQQLANADVVVALISSSFLASYSCYEHELGSAISRARSGQVHLLPVIIRPCAWDQLPVGQFVLLPTDAKPVSQYESRDIAYLEVCNAVIRAVSDLEPTGKRHESKDAAFESDADDAARLVFLQDDASDEIQEVLGDSVIRLDFDSVALADALAFVFLVANVPFCVDWDALDAIGVDPDSEVQIRRAQVPAAEAIDLILDSVSDSDLPASWEIEHGQVLVSSHEGLGGTVVTAKYDVRQLAAASYKSKPDREDVSEYCDELLEKLQRVVYPDGWASVGGDDASAEVFDGRLLITARPSVQREVSEFLIDLLD